VVPGTLIMSFLAFCASPVLWRSAERGEGAAGAAASHGSVSEPGELPVSWKKDRRIQEGPSEDGEVQGGGACDRSVSQQSM